MIDLKNKLIVIGFVLTLLGITMTGVINKPRVEASMVAQKSVSSNKSVEKSFFRNSIYFQAQGDYPFLLEADIIELSYGALIKFFKPKKGIIYQKKGSKVSYKAQSGQLDQKDRILFLNHKVSIKADGTNLSSEKLKYFFDTMKLEASKKVKTTTYAKKTKDRVFIKADNFLSYGKKKTNIQIYQGRVVGKVKRRRAYEESLSFKTNKLTFFY